MQRLPVVRHATANQARAKYRACRQPIEKTRWHALWLLLRAAGPAGSGGKNLRARLARLRARCPGKRVEVWAEDEARLGLKPIARRVWSLRGQRPRSNGRTRYDWLYVYGFARPKTGQTFCVLLPRVNTHRIAGALAAFAR